MAEKCKSSQIMNTRYISANTPIGTNVMEIYFG